MSKYEFMYPAEMIDEILNGLKNKKKIEFDFTSDYEELWDGCDPNEIDPSGWYGVRVSEVFDGLSLICGYYGGGIDFAINIDEYEGYEEEIKTDFCNHLYDLDDFKHSKGAKICVERMDEDNYDKEL